MEEERAVLCYNDLCYLEKTVIMKRSGFNYNTYLCVQCRWGGCLTTGWSKNVYSTSVPCTWKQLAVDSSAQE